MKPPIQDDASLRTIAILEPPAVFPGSLFSHLPRTLHADQIPAFLDRLAQEANQAVFYASEAELRNFVQWALQQSYSNQLTHVDRMKLLNVAWDVQKTIWSVS